jgi:hypothetical protein
VDFVLGKEDPPPQRLLELDLRCANRECSLHVLKLERDEIDVIVVDGPPLCPTCHQPLVLWEPDADAT